MRYSSHQKKHLACGSNILHHIVFIYIAFIFGWLRLMAHSVPIPTKRARSETGFALFSFLGLFRECEQKSYYYSMASRGETLWLSANGGQTCVDVTDFLYLFNLDSCPKLQNDNFERINNGKKMRGVYRFRLYLACVARRCSVRFVNHEYFNYNLPEAWNTRYQIWTLFTTLKIIAQITSKIVLK